MIDASRSVEATTADEAKALPRPTVGAEITEKEVHAWCDWFAAQGQEASARSIRRERGGKGSPEGIHSYVLTWRTKRDAANASKVPPSDMTAEGKAGGNSGTARTPAVLADLPNTAAALQALAEAIMADATAAVRSVQDEAARDQKAIRADCDRQLNEMRAGNAATIAALVKEHEAVINEMKRDLDEALRDAAEQEEAIERPGDGYKTRIAALKTEVDRLEEEIGTKNAAIERFDQEIARLRPFENTAAERSKEVDALTEQCARLEKDLDAARADVAAQKGIADAHRAKEDALREQLTVQGRDLIAADRKAAEAAGKAVGLEQALAAVQSTADDRKAAIDRLHADQERLRTERDALRKAAGLTTIPAEDAPAVEKGQPPERGAATAPDEEGE